MNSLVNNAHYFIFSDQPDAARSCIPIPNDQITVVMYNQGEENAYADLWLMSKCKHFIIANSTFSWWGAWLGELDSTIIIAPGTSKLEGISSWGFQGLLPNRWIRM